MGCVAQGCFEGVLRGGEVRYWGWISDRLQVCEGRALLVVDLWQATGTWGEGVTGHGPLLGYRYVWGGADVIGGGSLTGYRYVRGGCGQDKAKSSSTNYLQNFKCLNILTHRFYTTLNEKISMSLFLSFKWYIYFIRKRNHWKHGLLYKFWSFFRVFPGHFRIFIKTHYLKSIYLLDICETLN